MDMKILSGAQRVDFPAPVKVTMPPETVAYMNRRQDDRSEAEADMKAAQAAFQAAQIKHTSATTAANVIIDFVLETHGVKGHPYSIAGDDIIVQLPPKPRVALHSETPGVNLSDAVDTAVMEAEAIIEKKNCKFCGNEFAAFRRQTYCGAECQIKMSNQIQQDAAKEVNS